ncbi:replication protein A 70 kDa DNA-binding subunit A-like [Senna tora]|uniref:Replication protein A 70 kDa DNA-binding subunit A-like n=1 Tax=Senna tora TaxID=362788 RepID=A0A834T439_9FABA|nr:replication protein A 70 kDa DNA-binding subunit A-like [Senna tora]
MVAGRVDPISTINLTRTNWNIKVRVVRIWLMPTYPSTSSSHGIEMVLCDSENNKISGFFKSIFLNKFKPILKEGAVYVISQYSVGKNKGNFRVTSHEYKVIFQFTTRVIPAREDGRIHTYGFE